MKNAHNNPHHLNRCQKKECSALPTFKITFTPPIHDIECIYVCGIHKKIFEPFQEKDQCAIECIFIESNPDFLIQIDDLESTPNDPQAMNPEKSEEGRY